MELTKADETKKNGWAVDGTTYKHYNSLGAVDLVMEVVNLTPDTSSETEIVFTANAA